MMLANIGWSILLVEVFYMERVGYGFKEYKNRGSVLRDAMQVQWNS